ncbi:hypothetical protein [Paraburkholderia mimosarum]|uniref:hypothetical protein n=1 Tax=Paraburkholderia mimosarum TaxID=312026 RepID=UPI0012DEA205|nr:hypothetical protein [Paraburkholderia mimosarum]
MKLELRRGRLRGVAAGVRSASPHGVTLTPCAGIQYFRRDGLRVRSTSAARRFKAHICSVLSRRLRSPFALEADRGADLAVGRITLSIGLSIGLPVT